MRLRLGSRTLPRRHRVRHSLANAVAAASRSVVLATLAFSCSSGEARRADTTAAAAVAPSPSVVDSARPMSEMIARFQRGLSPVTQLHDGAASQAELVRRYVAALARGDTAALESMLISASEFAYLYFPGSALSSPPYELDPAFAWFQMQLENERGLRQALRAVGGRRLEYRSHECTATPPEGPSTIWRDCQLTWRNADGHVTQRAFMSIVEREGSYKFFSYANRLP